VTPLAGAGELPESLDQAGRVANRVLVRWLVDTGVSLLSACVLTTLHPDDAPMNGGEVAETIGISVEDAMRALSELRSLGYVREEKRRYEPTEEGRRLHESLTAARREAVGTLFSELDDQARQKLIAALQAR
jgi:predicted transcriptional regulator